MVQRQELRSEHTLHELAATQHTHRTEQTIFETKDIFILFLLFQNYIKSFACIA